MGVLCLSLFWYALLCALSIFCNHPEEKERAGSFAFIVLRISCYCKCSVAFPHDVGVGLELLIQIAVFLYHTH